jgi:hypothetical protein
MSKVPFLLVESLFFPIHIEPLFSKSIGNSLFWLGICKKEEHQQQWLGANQEKDEAALQPRIREAAVKPSDKHPMDGHLMTCVFKFKSPLQYPKCICSGTLTCHQSVYFLSILEGAGNQYSAVFHSIKIVNPSKTLSPFIF